MGQAHDFLKKSAPILEQRKPTFYVGSPIKGVGFTYETPHMIPPGHYVILEPDSRDNARVIIMNTETYRMYALDKRILQ
jgi:hypothetical protein